MSETVSLELDPLNPAQFFACCGLFELAAMRCKEVVCRFVGDFQSRRIEFELQAFGMPDVADVLVALKQAETLAIEGFAAGEAPVRIVMPALGSITLDWWLLPERNGTSGFKLWAGQQTTLNSLVRPMLEVLPEDPSTDLLSQRKPMSGRFGLDPRSAWNALDFGSSPNEQGNDVYTFPAAEMLAAIGLQGFKPRRLGNRGFAYSLWPHLLALPVARAAISGALPGANPQTFRFDVARRGSYRNFTFAQPHEE